MKCSECRYWIPSGDSWGVCNRKKDKLSVLITKENHRCERKKNAEKEVTNNELCNGRETIRAI